MKNNSHNPDILSCLANLSNDEVFTPPSVANKILDMLPKQIWSDENAKFLDPFSKSGVFLREIIKRLNFGLEGKMPNIEDRVRHILNNQIYGIALTELTSLIIKRTIYCSKTANSNYSHFKFSTSDGNIKYSNIKHSWVNGKCYFCGATEKNYNREEGLETYAYEFIHTEDPHELFDMKFDVIIGNPPYQLSDGGFGTSAIPIYDKFVSQAKKLNPKFLSMIIPGRWFSGGKGLDDFRKEMLHDKRIRVIHDFPDATDVFPGVQIKGGICYFLWSRDEKGQCNVISHSSGKVNSSATRNLLEEGADSFIRFNEAIPILDKVRSKNEDSIIDQISSRKPFGLATNFRGDDSHFDGAIKLFQNGGISFISKEKLLKNVDYINKYKVFIPPLGSGSDSFPHMILGKPFIGEPGTACTETYIIAGLYEKEIEAKNCLSYLQTRFLRFLVLLNKPSQHATSKVYQYVPKQSFLESWDDEKLYKKYNINKEEQLFIESLVKKMI